MNTDPFIAHRMRLNLAESGTTVVVTWPETMGGAPDPITGALLGGEQTLLSGTLPAFVHELSAQTVARQFVELQAGDILLDCESSPVVRLFPGQARNGFVPLASLAEPRFLVRGRTYAQKEIGDRLAMIWDAHQGNQPLHRTIALRRAT